MFHFFVAEIIYRLPMRRIGFLASTVVTDWKDSSCIWKIRLDKIPLRQQYSKQRISNGV